jgi:hypothetical protein
MLPASMELMDAWRAESSSGGLNVGREAAWVVKGKSKAQ